MRALSIMLFCTLLSACNMPQPIVSDSVAAAAFPARYRQPDAVAGQPCSNRWWLGFDDAQLTALIGVALSNNTTLAQAQSRLIQARALDKQVRSALVPNLNLDASVNLTRERETGNSDGTRESYVIGPAAAYELDLWGRLRSLRNAALSNRDASEADRDSAAMSVAAETTLRYFELQAARQGIDLLEQQLATSRETLELIELRFNKAQGTALDVIQQRQEVNAAKARLPAVRAREQILHDSLNVLLGRTPTAELDLAAHALPDLPPAPDAGLPCELLARRPDIRSAWLRLTAEAWSLEATRAEQLPTLRISLTGGLDSDTFSALFENWILKLGSTLSAPLFDAGRRQAAVEKQQAVVAERMAAYRETVLTSIAEVQQALHEEMAVGTKLDLLHKRLALAEQAQNQAIQRYFKGQENYLRVLTAMLSRQQLERDLVSATHERLTLRIALYRALGGDWPSSMSFAEESLHEN